MQKREKFVKFTRIILSAIGFIGVFLPLVTNGVFYLNIHHLGGPFLLLYLIAVGLLVLSITDLYKEINYIKAWFISLSIVGLLTLLLALANGMNNLDYFFSFLDSQPDIGAIFLFISYLGLIFVSFIKSKSANNKE